MAYRRPDAVFRSRIGELEFPCEDGRYILYVSLACPWATGTLQIARLKGLVGKLGSNEIGKMKLAVVHPTWQYTDPEQDKNKISSDSLAGGVGMGEPHAGWVFADPNKRLLPLALMKNGSQFGLNLKGSAEDICSGKVGLEVMKTDGEEKNEKFLSEAAILENFGVRSAFSTSDPSRHQCKSLRHLYDIAVAQSDPEHKRWVRPTTPTIFDEKTDRIVSNESTDIAKFLNNWGAGVGPDLYPEALRSQIDEKIEWIYAINNGVYRCGFATSQPAYDEATVLLEQRMVEVEKYMEDKKYLVGETLTIADVRLYNTLVRMDEVYVAYFKCGFASLFFSICEQAPTRGEPAGPKTKYPNLLKFTARIYNTYPEIAECTVMDDIRNHYFTSHTIRNMFAISPKEVGVIEKLKKMEA